jgi:hypothetical protein
VAIHSCPPQIGRCARGYYTAVLKVERISFLSLPRMTWECEDRFSICAQNEPLESEEDI